jgi:Tfp pilus assembly protein PilX
MNMTPEQQIQVAIVRIDIFLERIGYVLRITVPTVLILTVLAIAMVKLVVYYSRRSHAER